MGNDDTALFLATTVATSVTGSGFPVDHRLPSHKVGIISLVGVAVFVGVVQAFLKLSVLEAMAPTQTEPPFVVTQPVVLALFILLTIAAVIRLRSASVLQA